jgi:hypothetical protein
MFFLDRRKQIIELADALGSTQKEIPVRAQRVVEGRNDLSLHIRPGVDQQIATRYQVELALIRCQRAEENIDRFALASARLLFPYAQATRFDRLVLGMKGTLSEMELSTFRQRSQAALDQKARRGELFMTAPIGYMRVPNNRIEKDPDLRIREALDLVFRKFREFGSVRQVLIWFRQELIELPAASYGPEGRHIVWKLPVYNTLWHVLTNPTYGGAYAFGKTKTIVRIESGRKRLYSGTHVNREEWQVLIVEHHAGGSLLAGLLRCGHCGRRNVDRFISGYEHGGQ